MTERQLLDYVRYIIDKANKSPRAVFLNHDSSDVRLVDPSGPRFDRMILDYPDAFVGIYDHENDHDQIAKDIKATPAFELTPSRGFI